MKIFRHGIRLTDYKEISLTTPRFKKVTLPAEVIISLSQHEGLPARPVVKKDGKVLTGTLIGAAQGDLSANIHSSISGTVREVSSDFVRIESDGKDEWESEIGQVKDWRDQPKERIIHQIFNAGIVGLGGGGIPTALKLKTAEEGPTDTVVINGCESDAYITSDHVLMVNQASEVLYGAELLLKASGLKKCIIAIEDNKLEAIELLLSKMRAMHLKNIEIRRLPTKYPQGIESELVEAIFGKDAKRFERPPLMFNVQTTFAVYEAVRLNKPLFERGMTITGQCVVEPQNVIARIGTSALDLIKACKGLLRDPERVLFGGPMSGYSVSSLQTPVTKPVNGIVALPLEYTEEGQEQDCIRSGFCVSACPEFLVPETLIKAIRKKEIGLMEEFRLRDCIECGICTYVCPSKIPMAQILREGKNILGKEFSN